jgi:hypothetical protein
MLGIDSGLGLDIDSTEKPQECFDTLSMNGKIYNDLNASSVRPETCMMDVEAHHECSLRDTMVAILAIESRRHFDGKPNIYSSGLRCVFGTGRGQAKHLGDLY